ncbi:MAG: lysophospholipid acyltransferase family protein [Pseudomonadota bacterium]
MSRLRGTLTLAGFAALTLPLMPLQAVFKRVSPRFARSFPHWYHKRVCKLLGIRINQTGAISTDSPVLIVANHSSWVDIPVISAIAPVSFIAKKEVGGWPGVSALATLQRTVFVDREKRLSVGKTAREVNERLQSGDNLVLFAEGTSTDGNRVLPFRTSLFAAVKPVRAGGNAKPNPPQWRGSASKAAAHPVVQTLTIVYTKLHGVPLGRHDRAQVGWYGDMDMISHAWQLLRAGPLDVSIHIGPPISLDTFADRKQLAQHTEHEIRETFLTTLRGTKTALEQSKTG